MEDESSEDFFETFKSAPITTKKFCFKKFIKDGKQESTPTTSTTITSPFFTKKNCDGKLNVENHVNKTLSKDNCVSDNGLIVPKSANVKDKKNVHSPNKEVKKIIVPNKNVNKTKLNLKKTTQCDVSRNERSPCKLKTVSGGLGSSSDSKKLVNVSGVIKTNQLSPKISSSSTDNGDISPVIRPKKFTFKKKLSSSSLSSHLTISSSSENSQKTGCQTPKIVETKNPKVKSTNSFNFTTSQAQSHKSVNNLNTDEVVEINSSLEASQDDYMDDEEFERLFGGVCENEAASTSKSSAVDEFNLEAIDWGDNFGEEPSRKPTELANKATSTTPAVLSHFDNRKDDSNEFRKFYPHSDVMIEVLNQKFGLRTFRPHQREIINASLTQHDCFVLMPTGGGKSLCYQLPAILMPGVTIVISPLRALISDQVDKLNALDIPSAHMCSDVSKSDTDVILSKLHVREPIIKLLYLTPEKIVASRNVSELIKSLYQRGKLARFVIDEVHCLSQWGHDFRPDYKQLSLLRKQFRDVPIICLTATATKQVEGDVIKILDLKNVKRFIRSFNRPNIKYQVLPKTGKSVVNEIATLIRQKFFKKSGIIYCLCRADCDNLAKDLNKVGIKAKPYHAGMADKLREKQQREWMQDQFHVIVATIAFGMGIDKPDVRFVIHNSIPKSVESFYQESGRAGRDGETSYSYLFYSYADVGRLQRLMRLDKSVTKNTLDGHFENLRQMVSFAENVVDCRRNLQLMHLGEKFDRQLCIDSKETTCDNCENVNKYKIMDVTKEAKELAQIVKDISDRDNVTLLHIADIYKGSKIKKILDKQHNSHRYYASGANLERSDIHRILKDLIVKKMLVDFCTFTGEFPVVYIKPGPNFASLNTTSANISIPVHTQRAIKVSKPMPETEYKELETSISPITTASTSTAKKSAVSKFQISKIKVTCHEELLEECRRLAMERNVTLSSIMNLSAIKSMSEVLPGSKEEFLKIQHVTNANYGKFGEYFLKITTKFREQHDKLFEESTKSNVQSFTDSSFADEDDWTTKAPSPAGVKRKSTWNGGGYKRGAKRYKKTYRRKGAARNSPKKFKKAAGTGKKAGNGKLGLMPLHIS